MKNLLNKFKELPKEQRVKYIGIVGIAIVFCSFVSYGYFSNQKDENNVQAVEQIESPVSETQAYNSRLQAVNVKKDKNIARGLEAIHKSDTIEDTTHIEQEKLINQQIAQIEKNEIKNNEKIAVQNKQTNQNISNNDTGNSGGSSSTRGVRNNRGGGGSSGSTGSVSRAEKTKSYTTNVNEFNSYEEVPKIEKPQKKLQNTKKIKAKIVSQGYASTGKVISFVLLEEGVVLGNKVKKGQVVKGVAQEKEGRLQVNVSSIKIEDELYSVNMYLIGSDGIQGLPILEGEERNNDIENEVVNQASSITRGIPIVGGVINSAVRSVGSSRKTNKGVKLSSDIVCYLAVY